MSDKFFEALEKAKVIDATLSHIATLTRQLELAEMKLITCKRAMLDAVSKLNDFSIGKGALAPVDFFALANELSSVAHGASGLDALPELSDNGVKIETSSIGPPGQELTTARVSVFLTGMGMSRSHHKAVEAAKNALRRGAALL